MFYFKMILLCLENDIIQTPDGIKILQITVPKHLLVHMCPTCVQGTCQFVETEVDI